MARPLAGRLAAVYVSVFLFMAAEGALHVLVPPYLSLEYGLEPAAIGAIVGVFAFASLVARVPAGAAYTVRRARRLLLLGGGLSVLAFALLPFAPGTVTLTALMALDGLGWSIATTVQLALLVAAKPHGMTTGSAMGWYAGFTGLGHSVAGVTGGMLGDTIGLRAAFIALAGVLALGTALIVRAVPAANGGPAVPHEEHVGIGLRGALLAFRTMPVLVWIGVLVMFYINFVNGVVNTFHPVLALAAGLSLTQIGILASCRGWTSSISRLGSGALFARVHAGGLTTPLVLLSACAVFLIAPLRSYFWLQIPLFLAMGLSRGLLRVTGSADAFEAVDHDERRHGITAAVLHGGLDAGKVAGPIVGGIVAQLVGLATMFQLLPAVILALYFVLLVGGRRAAARTPRPA
jgi:predicted MFS family arabinose efflux permease